MKKIIKKSIFILLILILLFTINTRTYAWSDIFKTAEEFVSDGENSKYGDVAEDSIKDLSGYLYNILFVAGIIIAVIVATVLGIEFMITGAEGQAKVKEMMIPFIVGCIVVFGGFGIWKAVIEIGQKVADTNINQEQVQIAYINEIKNN